MPARIEAEPDQWVGQDPLALSTAPTVTPEGLSPRACVLRTFAVSVDGAYRTMPGGLARVAPTPDLRLVTNNAGAIAKDVWVLGGDVRASAWIHEGPAVVAVRPEANVSPRIAEDLYWFGRYAERAEGVVRLLRTAADRSNDFQRGGDPAGAECLRVLLEALTHLTTTYPGFVGAGSSGGSGRPASRDVLAACRRLAQWQRGARSRGTRRRLRTRCVTSSRRTCGSSSAGSSACLSRLANGPGDHVGAVSSTLAQVLDGLLALSGVVAETMVRDPGWRLLDAGRRVERAQQLTVLLRTTILEQRPPSVDSLVVESVLTSAESIITYRRRYRDKAQVGTVLDLLVLDEDNPRSLGYQLVRLGEDLQKIPGGGGASGPERVLDRIATRLRRFDSADLARSNEDGRRADARRDPRPHARRAARAVGLRRHHSFPPPLRTAAAMSARLAGGRYRVVHSTEYVYEGDVTGSYGQARLQPRELPHQTLSFRDGVRRPGAGGPARPHGPLRQRDDVLPRLPSAYPAHRHRDEPR